MSLSVRLEFRDQVLARYGNQLKALGEGGARKAMARALNYEGKKMYSAVKSALHRQTSIRAGDVHRALKTRQARPGVSSKGATALEFVIEGTGRELSLRYFSPSQKKAGTSAKVWGRRQMFNRAFMGPKPGAIAMKLNGNVFHRLSAERLPIEKMWGPSISKEMVKDQAKAAFEEAAPRVVSRVEVEIATILRGF